VLSVGLGVRNTYISVRSYCDNLTESTTMHDNHAMLVHKLKIGVEITSIRDVRWPWTVFRIK